MQQIKAFIHPHRISAITEALRNSGLCDNNGKDCYNVTVSTVQRLYTVVEPSEQRYSLDLAEPVVAEAKLELICEDALAQQLVDLIKQTGQPSRGWIFTSTIDSGTQMI